MKILDSDTILPKKNQPPVWYVKDSEPKSEGKNGDFFINTETSIYYRKDNGIWNRLGTLKGSKGEKGETGQTGSKGDDAYQVWLSEGNTGSVKDFLISLIGKQGPQGPKGERGPKGDKGDKGEKGAKGDRGENGREIELRVTDKAIQWRYELGVWKDLILLSKITSTKEVIKYFGGGGGSSTGTSNVFNLSDLQDVVISSPTTNQLLKYDGTKWVNATVSGSGAVDSVNGETGVVVLDADDIDDTSTTHKFATASQLSNADSALQPTDIATGTITPRADDLNLSGGSDGDVLTVQSDGSLALETPAETGQQAFTTVVDAAGNGDYTSISAAIADGATKIFVKSGSYTENSAFSITADNVSIVGESAAGVQIATNAIITVSGDNFVLKNVTFNSSDGQLFTNNTEATIIEGCTFNVAPSTQSAFLFYIPLNMRFCNNRIYDTGTASVNPKISFASVRSAIINDNHWEINPSSTTNISIGSNGS